VVEEKREAKVRRRLFRRDSFSRHSAFWHLLAVSVTGIDRASRPSKILVYRHCGQPAVGRLWERAPSGMGRCWRRQGRFRRQGPHVLFRANPPSH
jgi:hypothetical protein